MNESLALKSEDKLKNTFSVDSMANIQKNLRNMFEIEKNLEEIYTYIDIKFEEQEYKIKKMIEIKDLIQNTLLTDTSIQEQNNLISEKNKIGIKIIILIIFNFLIILFFIWLLYNSNDTTIKIIDTLSSNFGDNGNNLISNNLIEDNEIKKWIFKRITRFSLNLLIHIISIYLFYKNFYFTSTLSNNLNIENSDTEITNELVNSILSELSENYEIISDILDNISEDLNYDEAYNILDHLNTEYNRREEMLSKIESETEKILAELDSNGSIYEEPINNVSDSYNKKELGRSLIISSSILGSSIILYSFIPIILEIILK